MSTVDIRSIDNIVSVQELKNNIEIHLTSNATFILPLNNKVHTRPNRNDAEVKLVPLKIVQLGWSSLWQGAEEVVIDDT